MDEPGLLTYPYVHVQSGYWPARPNDFTYMCSDQLWDKQYQITNQYLDRFSRNLYFVALGVGVSVLSPALIYISHPVYTRQSMEFPIVNARSFYKSYCQ